jgi:hypothetical protein
MAREQFTAWDRIQLTAGIVVIGGSLLNGVKFKYGKDSIPPITEHIGDFALAAGPVIIASGMKGFIESFGRYLDSNLIENAGRFLPEITTCLTMIYFTLGESIAPVILPGTPSPEDIPAALIAAVAAYIAYKN